MQRLEVSGAVRPIYGSLGVKRLICYKSYIYSPTNAIVRCLKSNIKIYIKLYNNFMYIIFLSKFYLFTN